MRHYLLQASIILGLALLPLSLALAGEADVIDVQVRASGDGTYRFDVTNEQPFTRSLGNVEIPPEIGEVTVRARHNPAGYDGETMTVTLPMR